MKRVIRIHPRARLWVTITLRADGALLIEGQDLGGAEEYEYALTVEAVDVPRVVEALGGAPGADVLALLEPRGTEIVTLGERAWLRGLGLEPGFWARHG